MPVQVPVFFLLFTMTKITKLLVPWYVSWCTYLVSQHNRIVSHYYSRCARNFPRGTFTDLPVQSYRVLGRRRRQLKDLTYVGHFVEYSASLFGLITGGAIASSIIL